MDARSGSRAWWALAAAVLVVSVVAVSVVVDRAAFAAAAREVLADPGPVVAALAAFAAGFAVRAWAWARLVPGLPVRHAWAAIHVSLLGNHVLPLRLGEPLRVTSAVRRAGIGFGPAAASTLLLRAADVVALAGLVVAAAVWAVGDPAAAGPWWALAAVGVGATAALAGGVAWTALVRRRARRRGLPVPVRRPDAVTLSAVVAGWLLEAGIVWAVAHAAGVPVGAAEAVLVSGAAVLAQVAAVTPGGFGTYEAGAVAAWAVVGVDAGTGLALALVTHALATVYAVVAGGVAVWWPSPGELGRLRLPRHAPARVPARVGDGPVVLVLPAHDEERTVAAVVRRVPPEVHGRRVEVLVVDDGSSDATVAEALGAGADVVQHRRNLGLGAAVRTGFAEALVRRASVVAFCDADGEYAPEELGAVVGPVLAGDADYVVGSRFAGRIERMLPHRRAGNLALTAWVRWMSRRADLTDGQSGYRALSAAAAAEARIVHDYNYAQVLTLDLLSRGFRYAEVPITYAFRAQGRSFVRLGRYLWRVLPAVHRVLNAPVEARLDGGPRVSRTA